MATQRSAIDTGLDEALDAAVRFWCWWRSELVSFLPPGIRERLAPKAGVPLELTAGLLSGDPGSNADATSGIIPEGDFFRIRKDFPKAVKKNLREAISLQVEQLVPLEREAIHFGFSVLADQRAAERIEVEIVIVEKPRFDQLVAWAAKNKVPLETIRASSSENQGAGVLLWGSSLFNTKRNARRMNGLLAILLVILAGSASSAVSARWQASEENWTQLVREEQLRAVDARALQENIEGFQAKESARAKLRGANDVRQALAVLTEVLPDSAHAQRVRITGDTFQMDVVSEGGSALASALETALAADERFWDVAVEGASESPQAITVTGRLKR